MSVNNQNPVRRSTRPRVCERPDLRLTVRFRYHCDRDLIELLEGTPNRNELVRHVLRQWLSQHQGKGIGYGK